MTGNGFDPATFDPYRALGVARAATSAEIKRAHRTLAKRYHPDAATGDTALFLAVHEAYRLLSDPLLRRDWDDKHAPGPVRADAPPARTRRKTTPSSHKPADDRAAPRSTHAYRWSASEVPWWEEGAAAARQRRTRRNSAAEEAREPRRSTAGRPTACRPGRRTTRSPPPTSRSTTARAAPPGRWRRVPTSAAVTRTCRVAASSTTRARRS